jgi:ribose-phosphate pyrophosphokinase
MGYARQDREFLDGEIVSISVIGKLLRSVGAKKIITVDIHSKMALQQLKIATENVTAITELVKYFKKKNLKNTLIVSPDLGGKQRAEKFASLMNTDFIVLKKNRNRKTGKVDILTKNVDVRDRDLILVDDIISTGGSIIKSAQFLKKQKCKRVFVACTHALLMNDAENKIKKAGVTEIISTNTIPKKTSKIDVSKILTDAIL